MLNNIKSNKGFTIVELLIVIVVIAILAAISIVAYNGIQNRGKSSSAQSLASQVSKKAEAWNTVQSGYPSYCQFATNRTSATGTPGGVGTTGCTAGTIAGPGEAQIDDASKLNNANPSDEKTVRYKTCATGAQVIWWNATAPAGNTSKLVLIGVGGAASSAIDAAAAPTVCT